jgi:hypothetical protein
MVAVGSIALFIAIARLTIGFTTAFCRLASSLLPVQPGAYGVELVSRGHSKSPHNEHLE